MLSMFSSEPPSQYCSVMKYARTSCAVPGMKRSICGIRRSIFICSEPPVACLAGLGALADLPAPPESAIFSDFVLWLLRRRLSSAIGPLAGLSMSNLPSRVRRTTSPADIAHTSASQRSRRALSAGSNGRK